MTNGAFSHETSKSAIPRRRTANRIIRFILVRVLVCYYFAFVAAALNQQKGVGFLHELDPKASPNARNLRPRFCSHLKCEHSLDTVG